MAEVTMYLPSGDPGIRFNFVARRQGKNAYDVNHPDHARLRDRILAYFDLKPIIDMWDRHKDPAKRRPATTKDMSHPVIWNSRVVQVPPSEAWTIRLFSFNPSHFREVNAYFEDTTGDVAREIKEQLRAMTPTAAKPKNQRKQSASEDKGPTAVQVGDLPVNTKPRLIELDGNEYPVKILAKTYRERRSDSGGRERDPDTDRTADDDVFTFAATAYNLGNVSKILTHRKGVFVIGTEGVAVLQTIRASNKAQMEALIEKAKERGFKGKPKAIK